MTVEYVLMFCFPKDIGDDLVNRKGSVHADFFRPPRGFGDQDTEETLYPRMERQRSGGSKIVGEFPVPPPPPPPQHTQPPAINLTMTGAQKRRAKAIVVDRFSRVAFPLSFFLVNLIYWVGMWSYI